MQTYDALNRLISWTDGSKQASYTYYPNNDRATKTVDGKTTRHIWSGGEIQVDETDGETVDCIHGHRLIESGYGTCLYNVRGDVVQLVKGDQVVERYDYDVYGVPVEDRQTKGKGKEAQGEHKEDTKPEERGGSEAATAGQTQDALSENPYRYAGEYRDAETGYIYLRARFYDPDLGRFLNADPAKHGTNWYAYAGGNPVMYEDPSGLFFKEVWNGIKNTGKKVVKKAKAVGKVIQSAASEAGKKLKEFTSTNIGKVVIGASVIALAGVATVLTGGLAGGLVGNIAYGFFTGALMGGTMGAAAGGTEAVLSNRMETGSWSGSMQAFTDGAASGFCQGTISGGVTGGFAGGLKYGMNALGKGVKISSSRSERDIVIPESNKKLYIPRDADGNPIPLAKQRVNGQDIPLPDPEATGPHTVLGSKVSSKTGELYRQSATFPQGTWPSANGNNVPWSEVHWTDHGIPQHHTNPHQHIFNYDFENHYWKRGEPTVFIK